MLEKIRIGMIDNFYVDESGYYIKNSYQKCIKQLHKLFIDSFKFLNSVCNDDKKI